jgi:RHS repeat-associated protein
VTGQRVLLTLGDHLGSTSTVIDRETGELVEAVGYTAYGQTESDVRPDRYKGLREDVRFTGNEDDAEVGLTAFAKRYYAPAIGRWASPDPLALHAPGEADLNLYAYVHGRVYAATDPLGLAEDPAAGVSFVADGVAATDVAGQNVSLSYTPPEAPLPGPVAIPEPRRHSSFEATVDNRLTRDMKHAMRFPATCNAPLHVPDQGVGNYGFQLDPALTVGLGTQAVAGLGPAGLVFSQEGGHAVHAGWRAAVPDARWRWEDGRFCGRRWRDLAGDRSRWRDQRDAQRHARVRPRERARIEHAGGGLEGKRSRAPRQRRQVELACGHVGP